MSTEFHAVTHETAVCNLDHAHPNTRVTRVIGLRVSGLPLIRRAEPDWPRAEAFIRWVNRLRDVESSSGVIEDEYGHVYTAQQMIDLADGTDQFYYATSRPPLELLNGNEWLDDQGRYWCNVDFS